MALNKKVETSEVKVPGVKEKVSYSYDVLSGGDYNDALQHAGGNADLLAEAYFKDLNASAKANARQKAYNDNISPELKAKQQGIAAIKAAFKVSAAEAEAMWAKLNPDSTVVDEEDAEENS